MEFESELGGLLFIPLMIVLGGLIIYLLVKTFNKKR